MIISQYVQIKNFKNKKLIIKWFKKIVLNKFLIK